MIAHCQLQFDTDQAAAIQGRSSGGHGVGPSQGGRTDLGATLEALSGKPRPTTPAQAAALQTPRALRALGKNRRPFAQLGFSQSFAFTPRALTKPWLPSCTPTGQVFTGPRKSIFLFTVFRIVVYPTRMSPDFSSCDLQRRDPEGQVAASWFSPPLLAVFASPRCFRRSGLQPGADCGPEEKARN